MHNENSSALRTAAERIMAVRPQWEGVGLFIIENLETGACGMALVPADATPPDWSQALVDQEPGWDRHEDVHLATGLGRRWYRHLADVLPDTRWGELLNLLALHVPRALVTAMPAATRSLACGHGMAVHTLPPAQDADPLLGRLVAWLLPWERLAVGEGVDACAYWLPQRGVSRTWTGTALHGAGGRTRDERVAAGGMIEWGVLACWPSVLDAVVAFLLAQAEALPATQPAASAPVASAASANWADVQATLVQRMNRDRPAGKACPSLRALAKQIGCTHATVAKAIRSHAGLKAWQAESKRGQGRTTPPKAQALPTGRELARLIEQQRADDSTRRVRKQA